MVQEHETLTNEYQLRYTLDSFYQRTKVAMEENQIPKFKNLLEIIRSEVVILTAIHNIKANTGSITAGSDGETMRENILEKDYPEVISRIQEGLEHYKPKPVRRVYIPKQNKSEKRPLGIPTVIDRIIQECVRIVVEPICEAQFFNHSYGFRPMRNADMAMARATTVVLRTGYSWVVEGDIKGFFDNVNHTILIKRLWHMGIRDRRVLMVIKEMLKAGIMNEIKVNPIGTPQGGILSPLLANVYLDALDQWITREYEQKKFTKKYGKRNRQHLLKKKKFKPAYFIRYADDWILITDSEQNARKWKCRIQKYLKTNLKLELSEDKTLITNIKKKPICFLGFEYKSVRGQSVTGWIPKIRPNRKRLKEKVKEIHKVIQRIRKFKMDNKNGLVHEINRINSMIRGTIQYYETATWVNLDLAKYAPVLKYAAYKSLKKFGGEWGPANETYNLPSVHSNYTSYVAFITFENMKIGITGLDFCKWKRSVIKQQEESPFSPKGRELYNKRMKKKPLLARADDLLSLHMSSLIATKRASKLYNFEYFLNRAYTYNRDKGKCKVCGIEPEANEIHFHHVEPKLPISLVNRVNNLSTVHIRCHKMIHDGNDYKHIDKKIWSKIQKFRAKLN
ncbi:group II intron reverse transcriptase/maturase [Aneurinibacillus tyrosinisolvens]|uniref:group II intron reverse transcriptase/maturase n=1 Tax=Aneurinibacillus tyrosinisolvens TaxID=1443435 RepID=UPI00063F2DDA|nr:group II intron reverse transcriptase/maturase [Aneurinibacillus tyrosinisolvens]